MLQATRIVAAGNTLFMISGTHVATIELTSHTIANIDVASGGDAIDGLAVTKTTIWLADLDSSKVIRLDRAPGSIPMRIDGVGDAEDVLAVNGLIWVRPACHPQRRDPGLRWRGLGHASSPG